MPCLQDIAPSKMVVLFILLCVCVCVCVTVCVGDRLCTLYVNMTECESVLECVCVAI